MKLKIVSNPNSENYKIFKYIYFNFVWASRKIICEKIFLLSYT